MNKKFLLTVAVALVAALSFAQGKQGGPPPAGARGGVGMRGPGGPGGPGGPRRGMMNPELQKQLALTPAQKKKMEALQASMRKQMMALKPEERQTKGRAMFMKMRSDMDKILTAKQKAILAKWRKDHPRPGGPGGPGGRGGPGGPGGARGGAGGRGAGGGGRAGGGH